MDASIATVTKTCVLSVRMATSCAMTVLATTACFTQMAVCGAMDAAPNAKVAGASIHSMIRSVSIYQAGSSETIADLIYSYCNT